MALFPFCLFALSPDISCAQLFINKLCHASFSTLIFIKPPHGHILPVQLIVSEAEQESQPKLRTIFQIENTEDFCGLRGFRPSFPPPFRCLSDIIQFEVSHLGCQDDAGLAWEGLRINIPQYSRPVHFLPCSLLAYTWLTWNHYQKTVGAVSVSCRGDGAFSLLKSVVCATRNQGWTFLKVFYTKCECYQIDKLRERMDALERSLDRIQRCLGDQKNRPATRFFGVSGQEMK